MSQVFVTDSLVPWLTVAMQLLENIMVTYLLPWKPTFYSLFTFIKGIVFLYMKTPERAHSPAKMWEKKKLSKNYAEALAQVRNSIKVEKGKYITKQKHRLIKS
jgi:hypothetical protein